MRRLVALYVLISFAGTIALTDVALAAGRGGGGAAAATVKTQSESVLNYNGGKVGASLLAVASNEALLRKRARALYILVLLRLARVFVEAQGKRPGDAELNEAMAPLASGELSSLALQIGEFSAAWSIGKTTQELLTRKYAPVRFPGKMLVKVAAFGPVFMAWAAANGIAEQIREGRWEDGLTLDVILDLGGRVGSELMTYLAVTLALRLFGYPFRLLARAVAASALARAATARIAASTVALWGSRILMAASWIGWITLAIAIFVPLARSAYAASVDREIERGTGQRIKYLGDLEDALASPDGEDLARHAWGVRGIQITNIYNSQGHHLAPSKLELFLKLAERNNRVVDEKVRELKEVLLEIHDAEQESVPGRRLTNRQRINSSRARQRRTRRVSELKQEIRALFDSREAGFWSLTGLPIIGEREALEREMERLEDVRRGAGNYVILPPRYETFIERVEQVTARMGQFDVSRRIAMTPLRERDRVREEARAALQDKVDRVREQTEVEVAMLKSYVRKRLEQIERLTTRFPTTEEAIAERALARAAFMAVQDLTGEGVDAERLEDIPGFGDLPAH